MLNIKKIADLTLKLTGSKQKRLLFNILLGVGLWIGASYLVYRRFPNNYRQPNFFGEEGYVFAENLYRNGFFHALGTTFNGYYIWGIYILEQIAFVINRFFYNDEFINIARSFALVSYGFMGFISVLPLLLLRKIISLPALLLNTLFLVYVPLGGWDYGIIGTLGQTKFAILFIAYILLIYRHYLPQDSKKVYLVDFVLLISAYTNITIYPMLLFALLRYWPKVKGGNYLNKIRVLLRYDRTTQSLGLLVVLMLPQLFFIQRDGVPLLPGYLDAPYQWNRTIEIFISRSYLYQLLFPINKYLNNIIALVVFITILVLLWYQARRYRKIAVFGILSIFITTFLFVLKRTGISEFFIDYRDAGPSQFFFTQNWIFAFLTAILLSELIDRFKKTYLQVCCYLLIVGIFATIFIPKTGSFGANNFEEKEVGNIYAVAQKACKSGQKTLSLTIYPTRTVQYKDLPRERICTQSAINYYPQEIDLNLLPYQGNYLILSDKPNITQTFISPQDRLNGLTIYFSTFMRRVQSPYNLKLMDKNCQDVIRNVSINTRTLKDNMWSLVNFEVLPDSANQTYCFTITATKSHAEPLAIQLSQPNIYQDGTTIVQGTSLDTDIVFMLHYK